MLRAPDVRPPEHPRLCGEDRLLGRLDAVPGGTPPPMRGRCRSRRHDRARSPEHPRLCGEDTLATYSSDWRHGTPPPMRGRCLVCRDGGQVVGNTPAYAGNIPVRLSRQARTSGTPPPMRGRYGHGRYWTHAGGNTPVYAGKIDGTIGTDIFKAEHPRLCGEDPPHQRPTIVTAGTPPPMRGRCGRPRPGAPTSRNTPAYAGKILADLRGNTPAGRNRFLPSGRNSCLVLRFAFIRVVKPVTSPTVVVVLSR